MQADIPSLWSFIAQASPVVKCIILILVLCSIISWTIIIQRSLQLRRVSRASKQFQQRFWSGIELTQWLQQWQQKPDPDCANGSMVAAGLHELHKLEALPQLNSQQRLEAVERSMQVAQAQNISQLEHALSSLATIGSTSPYIGLLGTVWGIMSSFRALGQASQATLAMVAPGIAEALIATAIGLFAAIPAVIAYNRFTANINQLDDSYLQLQQSFLGLIFRQLETAQHHVQPPSKHQQAKAAAADNAVA